MYRGVYTSLMRFFPEEISWLAYLIAAFSIVFFLVNAVLIFAAVLVYMERRLLGRFHSRLGPNRVGPFGVLQPIADILKLLMKEDMVPRIADRLVFNLAPIVMVAPVLIMVGVLPFGKNSFLANLNIGILYVIAVTTVTSIGIFMAGWASGNKYAMFGAMRAVAQLVSYEVPMVLSIVGILLLTGSLSLVSIVEAQRLPFFLLQPLGFFVFLVAASAELSRAPFDLPEAESEIVAGYHIEYSGMKFGLLQLAEFAATMATAGIIATLFFRGWENPFLPRDWVQILPSHLWFVLKLLSVTFLFIWIRATVPRLRIDQVLGFAWKVLFPMALINLVVTAVQVLVWPNPTTVQLWAMVAINFTVAAAAIVGFSFFMEGSRRLPASSVVPMPSKMEVN